MRSRSVWLLCLACVGCHLLGQTAEVPPSGTTVPDGQAVEAAQLWQQGQDAMRAGEPHRAIAYYEESLVKDQRLRQNHLSLAAAYVEKGDDAKACEHLGLFLNANPGHHTARFYYAELLHRLKRLPEALKQFEQAIASGQEARPVDLAAQVQCHGRLLEIAETIEDDYLAHLHRGIGMYLLARERQRLANPDGELPVESLLCKAVGELSLARSLRPHEARPSWYLYSAWRQLAQLRLAERHLREAENTAPFSYLTPAEQRALALAGANVVPAAALSR